MAFMRPSLSPTETMQARRSLRSGSCPTMIAILSERILPDRPCLLVETTDEARRKPPPIRLESVDAQFELACQITDPGGQIREGSFTVVRCRSLDVETILYFLSVCGIIMRHLGDAPSRTALAAAVRRIASIFQNVSKPPVRSLNGLFGELFVISRSRSPVGGGCRMAERREITVRLFRRRCPDGCEELCGSGPLTHVFLTTSVILRRAHRPSSLR